MEMCLIEISSGLALKLKGSNGIGMLIEKPYGRVQPGLSAYLDERAVASLVGISVSAVRRWRLRGGGPPHRKIGRLVRYSRADVNRWMDGLPTRGRNA
jgi:predicted DNA-binding transcriptional regulator AlpA